MICNIESYLANGIKQNESYDALARICNLINIFKSSCESNCESRLVQFINALDEMRIELEDVYRKKEDDYIKDIVRLDNKLASLYENLHEKDAQLTLKDRELEDIKKSFREQVKELTKLELAKNNEINHLKSTIEKLKKDKAEIHKALNAEKNKNTGPNIQYVLSKLIGNMTTNNNQYFCGDCKPVVTDRQLCICTELKICSKCGDKFGYCAHCDEMIKKDEISSKLGRLEHNVKQSFENCKMDIDELKARVRALERSQSD